MLDNTFNSVKVHGSSEVFIPECMLADYCRIDTDENADFFFESSKIDAGFDRAHRRLYVVMNLAGAVDPLWAGRVSQSSFFLFLLPAVFLKHPCFK